MWILLRESDCEELVGESQGDDGFGFMELVFLKELVTEEEMKGMKLLEEKVEDSGMMDTYMDTKA